MRFKLCFTLEKNRINKDYRQCMISYFKHCLEKNRKEYLEKFFSKDVNSKNYTWGLYLQNAKFIPNQIEIENKKMILNFSTYSNEEGIIFFNSFMGEVQKDYPFGKENKIKLDSIELVQEKEIINNRISFKTLSHILVKERIEGENKDRYLTYLDKEWEEILKKNMKYQLKNIFDFDPSFDIENLRIKTDDSFTKKTVVNAYGISFPVTYGVISIEGEKYLLDYISKAGIGGKRNSGFGFLEII